MIDSIVKIIINKRWIVVLISTFLVVWTILIIPQMPLDVFPPFAPPQVEIETEAPGLAPEEVESLVTLPIESAINGTAGINAVRSASGAGISVVKVIFDWGTDIYQARQLVSERLQQARSKLPASVEAPQISPISSPIATVLQIAFTADSTPLMEVRRLVDWQVQNRLLAIPGVSRVIIYGGDVRQFQVLVDLQKLQAFNISLEEVTEAVRSANQNAPGGYLIQDDREQLIRGIGRVEGLGDLQNSVIVARGGVPITLSQVAEIKIGSELKRGDGSVNGKPAVIVMVNKQPQADTPTVTKAIETAIAELKNGLPSDIKIDITFRQADYISSSVDNVSSALTQGSVIVALILIPFLMNWRTLSVCLLDFVLTLIFAMLVIHWLNLGLNTMTLGGIAIAIGTAVDDAIVYGENTYRRLRENRNSIQPRPSLEVIFEGTQEVRESLLEAMVISIVVFSPVFFLPGVEGRIFTPMGIAYLIVVLISALESLLVSPALCALFLPHGKMKATEPWLALWCKQQYRKIIHFSMAYAQWILVFGIALLIIAAILIPSLGRQFLPEFQEQTLVNTLTLYPSSSLEATNSAGRVMELALKDDPRFKFIQTRSGRALGDGDAGGVNFAHLDVLLSKEGLQDRQGSIDKLRNEFAKLPGVAPNIGGFISHRMDEVLSGVRSAIAVKIFGADLGELRKIGEAIEKEMQSVSGVTDLQLEPQIPIPQIQIRLDRNAASRYGLRISDLAETIETALNGRIVSQILEQQQTFDLVVWLNPEARNNFIALQNILIDTPNGQKIPLGALAKVIKSTGPNTINRERVSRLIVVAANAKDRDIRSVVSEIQQKVQQNVQLPSGYFVEYGGQFAAEERASQNILIYSLLSFVVITFLMYFAVQSIPSTFAIMINLPIGLVGGVIAVKLSSGIISVASLVGFVSLFGVATRNGLLLVDNYNSKHNEGVPLKSLIVKGAMERLNAILMTALTSALGLLPLLWDSGAGKEILQPLSVVVFGGLFTSTALTLVVLPALYSMFGKYFLKTSASPIGDSRPVKINDNYQIMP